MLLLSAVAKASWADLRPAAEAGVACQHYIRNLWRNSAGNEASQSVAGSVCKGGRQQKPGEEAQSERHASIGAPKAFKALGSHSQNTAGTLKWKQPQYEETSPVWHLFELMGVGHLLVKSLPRLV